MRSTLTRKAVLENLPELMGWVTSKAEQFGMSGKRLGYVELAAEEALVNVISHAYEDAPGHVGLGYEIQDGCFVLEIRDSGKAFNILELEDPDTKLSMEERRIGGLGVFFMKKFMDVVRYRREDGQNVLTMGLRLSAEACQP